MSTEFTRGKNTNDCISEKKQNFFIALIVNLNI